MLRMRIWILEWGQRRFLYHQTLPLKPSHLHKHNGVSIPNMDTVHGLIVGRWHVQDLRRLHWALPQRRLNRDWVARWITGSRLHLANWPTDAMLGVWWTLGFPLRQQELKSCQSTLKRACDFYPWPDPETTDFSSLVYWWRIICKNWNFEINAIDAFATFCFTLIDFDWLCLDELTIFFSSTSINRTSLCLIEFSTHNFPDCMQRVQNPPIESLIKS